MNISRLHRVLKIITLLQGRRFYNADEMAAECEVSRRTVYRDLATIEKAGIPFFFDRATGGYRIHETGFLPPVNLNVDEALALVLMASELGRTGRLPLFQPARDAAAKIESTLPLGLRATLGSLVQHMAVRPGPMARHNALQQTYEGVRRALVRNETLQCVYISFHDGGQVRLRLDPYWLMFHERAWYVVGRSSRTRDVRTFKLGRFKEIASTGRRFKRPKDLTLEKHLGYAWRMIRGDTRYDVAMKFSPLVGPNVAEVTWHATQRVRWHDDGSITFTATVDGLDEIVWWVLGYGPHVEVLAPPELRARVREMTRETLARYDGA